MKQIRHGDVLLTKVATAATALKYPEEPIESGERVTVALGEVTGHAHVVVGQSTMYQASQRGVRVLEVTQPSVITHEEHGEVELEPGFWEIVMQREYNEEVWERVRD